MKREVLFQHRLALAMGRTVRELRRSMSWRELQHWQAFDVLHPLPDRLADIHHGILLSTIVNLMRSADTPPAIPADFFVLREREIEPEAELQHSDLTEAERLQVLWNNGG